MKFIYEHNRIYGTDEKGNTLAEITFPRTEPGVYTIEHTIVDESLKGQGIAGKLVKAAVEEIGRQGGEVRATCSYAAKWLQKHGKKKITFFHMDGCPYCGNAERAIGELIIEKPEYAEIQIDKVNVNNPQAELTGYDFYYVPCMFIGKEKVYEAHPGQQYNEIKEAVRNAFERAAQ